MSLTYGIRIDKAKDVIGRKNLPLARGRGDWLETPKEESDARVHLPHLLGTNTT